MDIITVLDFTQRLPGPLAGKILASLNLKNPGDLPIEVVKFVDLALPDPFASSPSLFPSDLSFSIWSKELGLKKKIIHYDSSSLSTSTSQTSSLSPELAKLSPWFSKAQGILWGLSPRQKALFEPLWQEVRERRQPLAIIEILTRDQQNQQDHQGLQVQSEPLHDLNALALTGLLTLHIQNQDENIVDPPFLPFAGIAFGQYLALQLMTTIFQSQWQKTLIWKSCSLLDSTREVLGSIWSDEFRQSLPYTYLHNGAFPCYNLYKTQDEHYVALAAVEEKFWQKFIQLFSLPLKAEDRISRDPQIKNIVSRKFLEMTAEEIEKLVSGHKLCLHLVYKKY